MVIPYVLYLLFLPSARVNGRVDRAVTCSLFALFVFLTLFEKAASWVFWDEFQSAFNFIAVDYLVYTHEVIANINESYPMGWILSALLLLTAVIVYAGRRFLFRRRHRRISAAACSQPRFTPLSACWPITMLTSAAWR